jgi:hypothetical protein
MAAIVHEQATNGPNISSNEGFSCLREGLNDPGPCPGQVTAIVAASPGAYDTPIAMAIRQLTQTFCRQCMCFFGEAEMSDWIALEAVRAALHNDELRRSVIDVSFYVVPGCVELVVACTGWQRDV